jgi:hypothetical protein
LLEEGKTKELCLKDGRFLTHFKKVCVPEEFCLNDDRFLTHFKQVCVPEIEGLRKRIMNEAYCSPYTLHPSGTKMYQDLKGSYWWINMKWDIARAMHNLPTGESSASEAGKNAQFVAYTKMEVE